MNIHTRILSILLLSMIFAVSKGFACNAINQIHQTDQLKGCKNITEVYTIIEEAIFVGAPTYNQGNPLGCYRIYEGAAYKIIYIYGNKCGEIKKLLKAALKKCDEYYAASDKAWVMRKAFDEILGVPTIKG
jgi:hypothetical protein